MKYVNKLRAREAFGTHLQRRLQRVIAGISTVTGLFAGSPSAQPYPDSQQTPARRRGDAISKSIEGGRARGPTPIPDSRKSEGARVGVRRDPLPSKNPVDNRVKGGGSRNVRRREPISLHPSIILRIRECLINAQQGVGVNTERKYRRMVASVPRLNWRAVGMERGWAKSTFRTHRAAFRWYLGKVALAAIGVGKETALTPEFVYNHRNEPAIRALAKDFALDEKGETADAIAKEVSRTKTGKKCIKRSKRRTLRGLPPDWPWALVHAMPTVDDQLATMVAIATGCRPAELRLGVEVTRLDCCRVRFFILGAKVSPRTQGGQPWRTLVIDICEALGPVAGMFLANLPGPGRPLRVSIQGERWQKKLKRRVRRLGWPDVSAYTLRHRLASILRYERVPKDTISQILGHASDRSRRHYGMFAYGRGSGGHGIETVDTASEVRQHDKASVMAEPPQADGGMDAVDVASADPSGEQSDVPFNDDDLLADRGNSGPSPGL